MISACALAALLLGGAAPARATPGFPDALAGDLDLAASPPCTLCHEGPTQRGTVTTPFGTSMRARGLVAYDEASLSNALLALEGEETDSDGDGVGDIEELRKSDDPNVAAGDAAQLVAEYGCSASRGGRRTGSGVAAFVTLFVVLLARKRRTGRDLGR